MYNQNSRKYIIACVVAFMGICISAVIYTYSGSTKDRFQCTAAIKIGVIDTQRIKTEASCFEAHDEIAQKIMNVINRYNKTTKKIRNEDNLIKTNKQLSQKEKTSKLATLELEWDKISKDKKDEMQNLQNLETKLTEYIQNKIIKIIGDIAKMNKIDIVLNKETKDSIFIFYHKKNMDITDSVINKLNQVIPTVNLKELEND